jgi:oxygen-dependent protoporphyrinogen oxidase
MEREYRSVIYAMWQASRKKPHEAKGASGARWSLFVTLRDGMQTIVEALAVRLRATVQYRQVVESIRQDRARWLVNIRRGESLEANGVVLATPAFQAAQLVQELDSPLSAQLGSISYSSAATVNLAFRRDQVPHPLNGFGFVVPHRENRKIIAGTFSSVKYAGRAPEGHVLLRAFVGGSLQAELFDRDDDEIEKMVKEELRQLLEVTTAPLFVRIARYPRSMPQYLVGHLSLVDTIEKTVAQHPGLAVAGNAYRGVGIADCVRSGEAAAEAVLRELIQQQVNQATSN